MHTHRWYLGIQSKKDPAHVMTEVYKAMQALGCVWNQVNNYRVICLWKNLEVILPDSQVCMCCAHVFIYTYECVWIYVLSWMNAYTFMHTYMHMQTYALLHMNLQFDSFICFYVSISIF